MPATTTTAQLDEEIAELEQTLQAANDAQAALLAAVEAENQRRMLAVTTWLTEHNKGVCLGCGCIRNASSLTVFWSAPLQGLSGPYCKGCQNSQRSVSDPRGFHDAVFHLIRRSENGTVERYQISLWRMRIDGDIDPDGSYRFPGEWLATAVPFDSVGIRQPPAIRVLRSSEARRVGLPPFKKLVMPRSPDTPVEITDQ